MLSNLIWALNGSRYLIIIIIIIIIIIVIIIIMWKPKGDAEEESQYGN